MAKAVAEGAKQVKGTTVKITRVSETLPEEVLVKLGAVEAQKQFADVPIVTTDDLLWADAIIFGSPTRFGNIAGQMKTFIDSLGGLWFQGALIGKLGGAFVSSATQHGGQESTILSGFVPFFFHQGMTIVGLPYSFQGQMGIDEINGCSPYGASTITGGQGQRLPSQVELEGARFQGKHIASVAASIKRKKEKKEKKSSK